MLAGQVQGGGQFLPGELAGGLQPPEREQVAVAVVQPAGGLGDLLALPGQAQPQDREPDEVGPGVGDLAGPLQGVQGAATVFCRAVQRRRTSFMATATIQERKDSGSRSPRSPLTTRTMVSCTTSSTSLWPFIARPTTL